MVNRFRLALGSLVLTGSLIAGVPQVGAEDWPHWMGARHDGVWHETGTLQEWPAVDPPVRWRVEAGIGYAGPAVAAGRVFVMDRIPAEPVEGGEAPPRGATRGNERIRCLDATTGAELWRHAYEREYRISYPEGPRTTPLVDGDKVYTLGAMGDLICFEAATGRIEWQRQLAEEYGVPPMVWGFSAHPRIAGDRLFVLVGGEGSGVVCLDKRTGEERWKGVTAEEIGYAPPVLVERAGREHLIVWHDLAVRCLDPDSGAERWSVPFPDKPAPPRPVVTIATPIVLESRVLVSDFYHGTAAIEVDWQADRASIAWRSAIDDDRHADDLNALMATPIVRGEHLYGVAGNGELRCLKLADGSFVWRDLTPTGERPAFFATAFLVPAGDRCWLFNDQGALILAKLSPEGYDELGRMQLLEPTGFARGRNIVWSHPAFADRCCFARNDKEIVCVDLSAG